MTTETIRDEENDKMNKTNMYNKTSNPPDRFIAGETAASPSREKQTDKENTNPQTNYRANRDAGFNAGDRDSNTRNPSNQSTSENKKDTGVNDRAATPTDKSPAAGGNRPGMGASDGAAIAPKTSEPGAATAQAFGRRDDTQKPNSATKKIDKDAPDEQGTPQTYDATGKKGSDIRN